MYETTEIIALTLKIIKIFLYFFFQALFLRRVSKKWRNSEPITLEFCTFTFFFCMMLGSLAEIYWMTSQVTYYDLYGASYVFFIGFIALTFLSIGIERSARLASKGLIALIPLIMAIITISNIVIPSFEFDITTPPYFFIALIVVIIPILFIYQGFKSEGLIRKQFVYIGIGYFFVFAGEALNYHIIETHLIWLDQLWFSLTGTTMEYIPPLLILFGLVCLYNGYVRLSKKLAF